MPKSGECSRELQNQNEFLDLEPCCCDGAPEPREVVVIGAADLLDEAVDAKAFQGARDLCAAAVGETLTQGLVGEAADTMLSSNQCLHENLVFGIQQIESRIALFAFVDARRDLPECIDTGGRCVNGRDELQVAAVSSTEHLAQRRQTGDKL